MAAMSTGTSFSLTFAVTTGAGPASPPRPRPPRPPPGPAADVLLPHAPTARLARSHNETGRARLDTFTLQRVQYIRRILTALRRYLRRKRHLMSLYVFLILLESPPDDVLQSRRWRHSVYHGDETRLKRPAPGT